MRAHWFLNVRVFCNFLDFVNLKLRISSVIFVSLFRKIDISGFSKSKSEWFLLQKELVLFVKLHSNCIVWTRVGLLSPTTCFGIFFHEYFSENIVHKCMGHSFILRTQLESLPPKDQT